MRARERSPEPRAAELVGDDRFPRGGGFARRGGQLRAIAYRFEKQQDHPRAGIFGEQLDQLGDPEVGLVADRYELRETQAASGAAREHAAEHRSALRHEARRPRGQGIDLEHGVDGQGEAAGNVDEPHAVGSEHPHAQGSRPGREARLPRSAFGTRIREAVAEYRRDRNTTRAALLDRALDRIAGRHDEGVVDRPGRFGEAAIGAFAQHFAPGRVDRDDAARVTVLAQISQGTRGVLRRVAGGADQRHRAGREERLP